MAANKVWTGATSSDWGTAGNWSGGIPGVGDAAYFNSLSTSNLNTTLGAANFSIQGIFTDNTLANDVSIGSAGGTLTFNSNGIGWWSGVTKNLSISAPIIVTGATEAWWVDPGRTVSISNTVTVNPALWFRGNTTKTGAGTFIFSGNVTANSTIWIGDSGYFGNVAITAGTFDNSTSASDVIVGQTGVGTLTVSGGTFKAPTNLILYLSNGSGSTGAITISGSGTIEAANSAQTIIVGRNNGTGTLNLDGGTLLTSRSIRGSNLGAGTGTVYFNGGTLKARDGNNANWLQSVSTFNAYVKGTATTDGAVFDTNGFNMGIPVALQHYASGPAIDGGLVKKGNGTLTLSNVSNSYTGTTNIQGGTLALVNAGSANNIASSNTIALGAGSFLDVTGLSGGGLTLANGQTIKGTGTVLGNLAVGNGATIAPGASPGTLTNTGSETWSNGGTFGFDIDNATAAAGGDPGWSLLTISGKLDLTSLTAGGFTIDIDSLLHASHNSGELAVTAGTDYYWDFVRAGSISGFSPSQFAFNTGDFSSSIAGSFSIRQTGNNLELVFQTVPEPTSITIWFFFGVFGAACGWYRIRRR